MKAWVSKTDRARVGSRRGRLDSDGDGTTTATTSVDPSRTTGPSERARGPPNAAKRSEATRSIRSRPEPPGRSGSALDVPVAATPTTNFTEYSRRQGRSTATTIGFFRVGRSHHTNIIKAPSSRTHVWTTDGSTAHPTAPPPTTSDTSHHQSGPGRVRPEPESDLMAYLSPAPMITDFLVQPTISSFPLAAQHGQPAGRRSSTVHSRRPHDPALAAQQSFSPRLPVHRHVLMEVSGSHDQISASRFRLRPT